METGYVDDPELGLMIEFSLNKKKKLPEKNVWRFGSLKLCLEITLRVFGNHPTKDVNL